MDEIERKHMHQVEPITDFAKPLQQRTPYDPPEATGSHQQRDTQNTRTEEVYCREPKYSAKECASAPDTERRPEGQ